MLRLNPEGDFETVVKEMTHSLEDVQTGEITIATRTVEINGVDVHEGEVIAILNGKVVLSKTSIEEACLGLLEIGKAEERERITLFYGDNISKNEVNQIVDDIRGAYPSHEIELHDGGQPHYQFIIAIE
jgi:dihydroxyacetone kinase-like predicted kinase